MRPWRRAIAWTFAALLAAPALYVAVSFALVLVPVNADWDPDAGTVRAYVASNGVHADLVLPVRNPVRDWRDLFPAAHFAASLERARFVAIGWGDREFYLHTPTWADLTVERGLRALTGANASLVHVTYLSSVEGMVRGAALSLDEDAYRRLVAYVDGTLRLAAGRAVAVPGYGYSAADAFFEAHGSYSALETCNVWVGRALEEAGVTVPVWTPFDVQAMWHLPAAPR